MAHLRPEDRTDSYIAIIADVVGSRAVDDRPALQRRLVALLEGVNREHGGALSAPLRLVGGDEFQGLLALPAPLIPILVALEDALHPVQYVAGIGLGGLSTDPGADVGALDGPAFHRAREALDGVRRGGGWVRFSGWGEGVDPLLTAAASLTDAVRSRWTPRQREFVRHTRSALQREVAERLGVAESTVSESLKASRFGAVLEAEKAVAAYLSGPPGTEWSGPGALAREVR